MLYNTIDISHYQTVNDYQAVKDDGIELVIHKATEGASYVDRKYEEHRKQFVALGTHWGSYHFGIGGSGVDQATTFLEIADRNGLLVLDLEENPKAIVCHWMRQYLLCVKFTMLLVVGLVFTQIMSLTIYWAITKIAFYLIVGCGWRDMASNQLSRSLATVDIMAVY